MQFIRSTLFLMVFALLSACSDSGNNRAISSGSASQAVNQVEVWKTPTCGCCAEWVKHLESNGFTVTVHDVGSTDSFRAALGMPQQYGSCHSARVAGYAIEGHVPAADIQKLLAEKPAQVIGLSVPAMPMGSPGMEHPDFPQKRAAYDVLLINQAGQHSTYTHYEAVN